MEKDTPIYKNFEDAQAALDRGEEVRIEVEPFTVPLDLLRLARQFQDKERLNQWRATEGIN
ncbi:hypothetical protein [Dictyobacter arantiisoli]|uniref:Uncharacterized protein n=1 Tax=Dictyobacter arantiisoli TaxID=2014874 RepID=A0A5A5T783_9CHLR|nr:hypothetical protein [Dictyobacter arantiisoli]GCF07341.1 hypothetical protein KDI_09050 [Dictyobacter arantiisoli]